MTNMKRLVVIGSLNIWQDELANILVYRRKDKQLYTFTEHTDQLRALLTKDDILKHTKKHTANDYCLISGKGEIGVVDNYEDFCSKVKNSVPVTGEIYVNNKNNSMNTGTNYVNNYLTYSDEEILQYLNTLYKKHKYSKWKKYAIVVGVIEGSQFSEMFSGTASVKLVLNNTLLKISNNMTIVNNSSGSVNDTYTGGIMSSGPNRGPQIVGYEIKMFTFGIFSGKAKFI